MQSEKKVYTFSRGLTEERRSVEGLGKPAWGFDKRAMQAYWGGSQAW